MLGHPEGDVGRDQRQRDLDLRIARAVAHPQAEPADGRTEQHLTDNDGRERAGRLRQRKGGGGKRHGGATPPTTPVRGGNPRRGSPGRKGRVARARRRRGAGAPFTPRPRGGVPASTASRITNIWNLASTVSGSCAGSICPDRRPRQCREVVAAIPSNRSGTIWRRSAIRR